MGEFWLTKSFDFGIQLRIFEFGTFPLQKGV